MPQMADITVKNAANADVVLVARVPSAGDKTPARWGLNAASAIPAFRPDFTCGTRDNSDGRRRIGELNAAVPVTQEVNGVMTLVDKVTFTGGFSMPKSVSTVLTQDAVVIISNWIASQLVRSAMEEGFAPT